MKTLNTKAKNLPTKTKVLTDTPKVLPSHIRVFPSAYMMKSSFISDIVNSNRYFIVDTKTGMLGIHNPGKTKVNVWYRRPDGSLKLLSRDLETALIQLDDEILLNNAGGQIVSKQLPGISIKFESTLSNFKENVINFYETYIK